MKDNGMKKKPIENATAKNNKITRKQTKNSQEAEKTNKNYVSSTSCKYCGCK